MTKITTPVEGFTGIGPGGLAFEDGVAETDDEALLNYFASAGYGVGDEPPRQVVQDPPVDARDVEDAVVGTRLRDAAVDPHPEDFLPPTNAGQADPHGPLVVAPEIHASGTQVVRPGQVFVDDLAAQQAAETEQATKLLVEQQPADEAVATFPPDTTDEDGNVVEGGADRGPLGLSDPGSVVATDTGNAADTEKSTNPDGSSNEPPAANASLKAWQEYATSQGATPADLEGKKRDELRDLYTEV